LAAEIFRSHIDCLYVQRDPIEILAQTGAFGPYRHILGHAWGAATFFGRCRVFATTKSSRQSMSNRSTVERFVSSNDSFSSSS
jgi:hypothetical protein